MGDLDCISTGFNMDGSVHQQRTSKRLGAGSGMVTSRSASGRSRRIIDIELHIKSYQKAKPTNTFGSQQLLFLSKELKGLDFSRTNRTTILQGVRQMVLQDSSYKNGPYGDYGFDEVKGIVGWEGKRPLRGAIHKKLNNYRMISLDDDSSTKRHLETYALLVDEEEDDKHYVIDIGIIVTKHGYYDEMLGDNSPSKTSPARKRRKALKDSEVFRAPDILCINMLGPVKLFAENALMQVENK